MPADGARRSPVTKSPGKSPGGGKSPKAGSPKAGRKAHPMLEPLIGGKKNKPGLTRSRSQQELGERKRGGKLAHSKSAATLSEQAHPPGFFVVPTLGYQRDKPVKFGSSILKKEYRKKRGDTAQTFGGRLQHSMIQDALAQILTEILAVRPTGKKAVFEYAAKRIREIGERKNQRRLKEIRNALLGNKSGKSMPQAEPMKAHNFFDATIKDPIHNHPMSYYKKKIEENHTMVEATRKRLEDQKRRNEMLLQKQREREEAKRLKEETKADGKSGKKNEGSPMNKTGKSPSSPKNNAAPSPKNNKNKNNKNNKGGKLKKSEREPYMTPELKLFKEEHLKRERDRKKGK